MGTQTGQAYGDLLLKKIQKSEEAEKLLCVSSSEVQSSLFKNLEGQKPHNNQKRLLKQNLNIFTYQKQ